MNKQEQGMTNQYEEVENKESEVKREKQQFANSRRGVQKIDEWMKETQIL